LGTARDYERILDSLKEEFLGNTYNILTRNCNHFANALVTKLLNKPIPGYVNRLANLGGMVSCLFPPQLLSDAPVDQQQSGSSSGSTSGYQVIVPRNREKVAVKSDPIAPLNPHPPSNTGMVLGGSSETNPSQLGIHVRTLHPSLYLLSSLIKSCVAGKKRKSSTGCLEANVKTGIIESPCPYSPMRSNGNLILQDGEKERKSGLLFVKVWIRFINQELVSSLLVRDLSDRREDVSLWGMDCVTMVLVEKETGLPLDLVVLINNFLYEKLTDENFKQAIALWFDNEDKCKWRFGHISDWNTSRVTIMHCAFYKKANFNEDISRWNVGNVTDMSSMFVNANEFNGNLSKWDVKNVTSMRAMFDGARKFNRDLSGWDVCHVTNMRSLFHCADSTEI
jgi:surface protein